MTRQLADFIGTYDVSRVIKDARAGATSQFEGQAVIGPHDDDTLYTETGHLILNEQRFAAERRYIWRSKGARVDVAFEDGRAFHDFDLEVGGDATEHLCGSDMYRGGYDFSHWPRWSVTWTVSGPRKDYTSVTWYVPQR